MEIKFSDNSEKGRFKKIYLQRNLRASVLPNFSRIGSQLQLQRLIWSAQFFDFRITDRVDFFWELLFHKLYLHQNPPLLKVYNYYLRKLMGKRQTQDKKAKRYSKISNALKSYFFRLIYVKELTIKESARICRLNYSTAKAIIRDLTQKEKEFIEKQVSTDKVMKQLNFSQNFQRSDYRETSSSGNSSVSNVILTQIANYHGLLIPKPIKKINIVSTTGYDFLNTSTLKVENQY